MGIESMRGSYGRCSPLVVGGLSVICLILTCNWWLLSSQNYDLIRQLEDLGEQLKISSDERAICGQQRSAVESHLKSVDDELAQNRIQFEQQQQENVELRKQIIAKEDELKGAIKEKENALEAASRYESELESLKKLDISKDGIITTLKVEKDRNLAQLAANKIEIDELQEKLKIKDNLLNADMGILRVPKTLRKSSTAAVSAAKSTENVGMVIGQNHQQVQNKDQLAAENDDAAAEILEVNSPNPVDDTDERMLEEKKEDPDQVFNNNVN